MERARQVAWGWIAFFALFTIVQYLRGKFLFDYIAYIAIISALLLASRRFTVPTATVWCFGMATMMHAIGTIAFTYHGIPEVSLYHDMFFGGNYDLFTHFYGLCVFTVGMLIWFFEHHKPTPLLMFTVGLAMIGSGALIEMTEFAGYSLFGFGWGAFAFGAGDNSMNFGPWGDSMTDLYANLIGIMLGFFVWTLVTFYTRRTKAKSRSRKNS